MSTDPNPSRSPADDPTWSVDELAAEAGVTRRTIYYYVSQGLLPGSGIEGRGSRYTVGHLNRLRLIRELQREHLPLADIRQRVERLDDGQVADLLAAGGPLPAPRGTAFDYIQSVLAGTNRRAFTQPLSPRARPAQPASAPAAPAVSPQQAPAAPPAAVAPAAAKATERVPATSQSPPPPSADTASATRSQWERISLAPDVELHVRRPLSRLQNRAVERLLVEARRILEEDPS